MGRVCRVVLWLTAWVVPVWLREEWRKEWCGDLWQWMVHATGTRAPGSRSALIRHTQSAVREALRARFRSERGMEDWQKLRGSPGFCLAAGAVLLALVALLSDGFAVSRRLAHGLPYGNAERVVVLAQGPPTLGIRLGFRDREVELFRQRSETLDAVATYVWYTTNLASHRNVPAAKVSGDFFKVFGLSPSVGQSWESPSHGPAAETFLISYEFWKSVLAGDAHQVGRKFEVGGRVLTLGGVMPRGFSFLGKPVSIWTIGDEAPAAPDGRWWLSLKGTVGRLRAGVPASAAETELRRLLVREGLARRNYQIHATAVGALEYRALTTYSSAVLDCFGALVVWAVLATYIDRRRGYSWGVAWRYWSFFALKSVLPLLAVFFFVFECTGINTLGVTGGIWWYRELFSMWLFFCGVILLLVWMWRDHRGRCRVCCHRMRQPLRIGVPGGMLLDPAGLEVICPQGHGSVYTSDSVLGAEMSNRWLGYGSAPL